MAITTYSELKTAIANRLHRSDLTSVIPDFITVAEARLARKLRVSGLESTDTITCVAGTQSYALPADFEQMINIYVSGDPNRDLERITLEVGNKKFGTSETSKPYAYAIVGSNIYLYYAPDSDYTINLVYYSRPTVLSDANTSNYFLTDCLDALLYYSLIEAADHIGDDQKLAKYSAKAAEAVAEILEEDALDKWGGSNIRVHQV